MAATPKEVTATIEDCDWPLRACYCSNLSRVNSSLSQDAFSARRVSPVRWTQLYLGLSLTTLATLILELALTRIFSVVFYYHFAFLAISIALFGLGAGGVFSYVVTARTINLYRSLGRLLLADSISVVAALWFLLSRAGDLSYSTLATSPLPRRFFSLEPWCPW